MDNNNVYYYAPLTYLAMYTLTLYATALSPKSSYFQLYGGLVKCIPGVQAM